MNFEEKLIEFVKEAPFMYDKKHPQYRNMVLKHKKWQEISQKLQKDEYKCRQKWANLRDQCKRELRKLESPLCRNSKRRPKWKYFKKLNFLSIDPISTSENVSGDALDFSEPQDEDSSDINEEMPDTKGTVFTLIDKQENSMTSSFNFPSTSSTTPLKIGRISTDSNINLRQFLDELRNELKKSEDDEIDAFFRGAAIFTRAANLTKFDLINLELEILNLIKSKMKK